jgi:hypothetical protein
MRTIIHWLLDPWVIVGSLMVAFVLSAIFFLFVNSTRYAQPNRPISTAILKIIAAPTFLPSTQTSQTISDTLAVENSKLTPSHGDIKNGIVVQVTGTGGDGLRMRVSPGLEYDVVFVAKDGDIFRVADGPQEGSGYTWWYLISPLDDSIRGWVVVNFLSVYQSP